MSDYYQILGLPRNADMFQIRKAYYELVKKWHPDKYRGPKLIAQRKLAEINKAYETLGKDESKKAYDQEHFPLGNRIFANISFSDIDTDSDAPFDMEKYKKKLDEINDALRKAGVDISESESDSSDSDVDIEKIKAQFGQKTQTLKGSDISEILSVTLEDIYDNAIKKLKYTRTMSNKKTKSDTVNVQLKQNMQGGELIVMKGMGNYVTSDGKVVTDAGDVLVHILIEKHPMFTRNGNDLMMTMEVTPDEAMNGFTRTINGINGKSMKITIDKLKKSSDTHIEKGKGLKKTATGTSCGNLIINFVVVFGEQTNTEKTKPVSKPRGKKATATK